MTQVTERLRAAGRAATTSEERPGWHRWAALGVLGIAQLMVVLDATIVNIALPDAQKALAFSNGDRQWIVTAYSLAFGGLLLLGGRMSDLIGRRKMFLIGLIGFAAASAAGGAAVNFPILVSARALQGAFGALLAPAALSLLTTTFTDGKERAKAFAIFGAIAGGGAAVGLLLGGVLTEYLNWRWCLYVNIAFAVMAVLGALAWLRDQVRPPGAHLDIPGTLVVIAGLVSLVYGFSEADQRSWGDPVTIGLLIAAAVLLTAFAVIENKVANPLLPMRVLLDRNRGASYLAIGFSGIGMFGVFLFLTYYLQQTLHYSPVTTGLAFLPLVAGIMTAATTSGSMVLPRIGPRVPVAGGLVLVGAAMVLLTQIGIHTSYVSHVLPAFIVFGLGMGLIFGSAMNVATANAEEGDAGVASAMPNTVQQVAGALGTALLNTIAGSAAGSYVSDKVSGAAAAGRRPSADLASLAAVHGYHVTFVVVAVVCFLAAGLCFVTYQRGVITLREGVAAPAV